jgi:hypothetical protein
MLRGGEPKQAGGCHLAALKAAVLVGFAVVFFVAGVFAMNRER